jgi:hypothetical protein
MPLMPSVFTKSSTERVDTPWMYASWITAVSAFSAIRRLNAVRSTEEAGEVGASAQAGDAQFHRARARLPVTLAVAVPLHQAVGAT